MPTQDVLIVGGGFSGSALLIQLLRRAPPGVRIALLERSPRVGPGLAYATPQPSHVLNVPAGRMGLDPEDEAGFARWLQAQGRDVGSGDFVPRAWYGDYLTEAVQAARRDADRRGLEVTVWHDAATEAEVHGGVWHLRLASGRRCSGRHLVLATGHTPPTGPAGPGLTWQGPAWVENPWDPDAWRELPPDAPVLLLGTGLTAVDWVMQLRDRGHRGRIQMLSRRGCVPQAHRPHPQAPPVLPPHWRADEGLGLRAGWRRLRTVLREPGLDWRDVLSSLRAETPALWRSFSEWEQRQFLRHGQALWDAHRHRLAPAVADRLAREQAAGTVQVAAGRVRRVDPLPDGQLDVQWQPRGTDSVVRQTVAGLVNCTGPQRNPRSTADPLLRRLLDGGAVQAHPLGLGLQVDEHGCLQSRLGWAGPPLFAIGPACQGRDWESTAVPELRVQGRELAALLASRVQARPAECSGSWSGS